MFDDAVLVQVEPTSEIAGKSDSDPDAKKLLPLVDTIELVALSVKPPVTEFVASPAPPRMVLLAMTKVKVVIVLGLGARISASPTPPAETAVALIRLIVAVPIDPSTAKPLLPVVIDEAVTLRMMEFIVPATLRHVRPDIVHD